MSRPTTGRTPILLLLAVVAVSLPFASAPVGAADTATATRFDGGGDAETAAQVADFAFDAAASAVLARGDGAGPAEFAPEVAAHLNGPVLLADADSVPPATMTALSSLGVDDVVLMGDASVIGSAAADALIAAGYSVTRLESALDAAELVAGDDDLPTVYLASSGAPVDQALAAAAAGANGTVALEVPPGTLPDAIGAFLGSVGAGVGVSLVGEAGEAPGGRALADALAGLGIDSTPLFGRDAFETSVALEETAYRDPVAATLANPESPASTLVAAGLAALRSAPTLLVPADPPLPGFVEGALSAHATSLAELWVVGGDDEVSEPQVDAAVEATSPIGILPIEDVQSGMVGTGHTVVEGIDPSSFDVEVIDVLEGAIAPDIPLILVRTSGPVIEDTGGIAAGFSGSPVYVEVAGEPKLMGAIAYGCSACDQTIGGVTPAEPMLDVLAYPTSASARSAAEGPRTIEAHTVEAGPIDLRQLDLPAAIGGLSQRRFDKVAADMDRAGLPLQAFRSSAGGGPVFAPFDPLFPGHSYAGVLSAGAVGFAGIGTTTYRDGDRSLGFGHPFFFQGPSGLGLSSAEVHFVWRDPSSLFGPFKVASVTGPHGTMDQDRLAAVAGTEGVFPHFASLPTGVENLDTARTFAFRTESVMFSFLPDVAAISLLQSLDRGFDRVGGGTVDLGWAIEGRDGDGDQFSLELGNRYANNYDVTFESIFELLFQLYILQENDFEAITFDRVATDATVTDEVRLRDITGLRARSSSFPHWVEGAVRAAPGDIVIVEVALHRRRGDTVLRRIRLEVPPRARGRGVVNVRGGGGGFDDFFFFDEPGGDPNGIDSFDELLEALADHERNDDLIAELFLEPPDAGPGPAPANHEPSGRLVDSKVKRLDEVVSGSERIRVRVVR